MKKNKSMTRDLGQSLVEFALVLPVVIMLMLGVLDLGRAFYIQLALRDAADEGASYAAISPNDDAEISARVVDAATALFTIDASRVSVDRSAGVTEGAPITVRVDHPLTLFTPFVQDMVGGDELMLTGEATHAIIMP